MKIRLIIALLSSHDYVERLTGLMVVMCKLLFLV